MPHPRNLTIGIFGHYGNENMGDEAIVAAVIEEIRSRYPTAEILGFSIVPEDTERRHGIAGYPIRRRPSIPQEKAQHYSGTGADTAISAPAVSFRALVKRIPIVYHLGLAGRAVVRSIASLVGELRFLWASYRRLKEVDLLIVAGSGQLLDEAGIWGFPYTLYKWSLLCQWTGCRLAFVGVGAGPLRSSLSRWFIKQALTRAGFRAYRDQSSHALVNTIGDFRSDSICPDLAFGKVSPRSQAAPAGGSPITVGINPMAYHDPRYWPNASKEIFNQYLAGLTRIIKSIADTGDRVVLFPTQLRADTLVIDELQPELDRACSAATRSRITTAAVTGVESQLAAMAAYDLIIATRFHGVVLAYLVGKPTIGISYHDKIRDLTTYMGHPDCSLPIYPLDADAVIQLYLKLKADLARSQSTVLAQLAIKRRELAQMYDQMFARLLA